MSDPRAWAHKLLDRAARGERLNPTWVRYASEAIRAHVENAEGRELPAGQLEAGYEAAQCSAPATAQHPVPSAPALGIPLDDLEREFQDAQMDRMNS